MQQLKPCRMLVCPDSVNGKTFTICAKILQIKSIKLDITVSRKSFNLHNLKTQFDGEKVWNRSIRYIKFHRVYFDVELAPVNNELFSESVEI